MSLRSRMDEMAAVRKPTPGKDQIVNFLRGAKLGPGGTVHHVTIRRDSIEAEPWNRERLDHYRSMSGFDGYDDEDEDEDDGGWNEEAWSREYAIPMVQAARAAFQKEFGKVAAKKFGWEVDEKGWLHVRPLPKWSKALKW